MTHTIGSSSVAANGNQNDAYLQAILQGVIGYCIKGEVGISIDMLPYNADDLVYNFHRHSASGNSDRHAGPVERPAMISLKERMP